jgi:hypothetical protein
MMRRQAISGEQRDPWAILSESRLSLANIRRVAEEVAEITLNCQGQDSGRPTAADWRSALRVAQRGEDALLVQQRQGL